MGRAAGSAAASAAAAAVSVAALLLAAGARPAAAFYLPGVAPADFKKDAPMTIKVNKLSSTRTQLPYEYYTLPFCRPDKIVNSAENLGEVLRGDRIENSVYIFSMENDEQCKFLCRIDKLSAEESKLFKERIDEDYRVNMILDNLPVAVPRVHELENGKYTTYERGYAVGKKVEGTYAIHNHLSFTVLIHKDPNTETSRIVGFEVKPVSIKHTYDGVFDPMKPRLNTCNPMKKKFVDQVERIADLQTVEENDEIIFTHDVNFTMNNEIKWASRWDTYLLMTDDHIHWFSIINSLMIVLFLSGMVAMIMMRTLHRDISKYNQLETQDEAQEETGWKLVHGDVFRPPAQAGLLCVFVGTGVQFFGMTVVTMAFAVLGFLSPANRGGLTTAMLLLWVFMGLFAGYSSSRLYKMFKGTDWKMNTLKTAFLFPGTIFVLFSILNFLIWGEKSSGAVPFGTMFALFFLWFGISVPLVFIGSYFGYKKPAIEDPVRTNKIPRQIPEQAWYMRPLEITKPVSAVLYFGYMIIISYSFFVLTGTIGFYACYWFVRTIYASVKID
eukprot:SM000131S26750  [mRNA]  locus=s131:364739:367927:+ [translate_table: standard]